MNSDDGSEGDGSDGSDFSESEDSDSRDSSSDRDLSTYEIYRNSVWRPAQELEDLIRRTISEYRERRFDSANDSRNRITEPLTEITNQLTNEELQNNLTEDQFSSVQEAIYQFRDANTDLAEAEGFRQDNQPEQYEQRLVNAEEHLSLAQEALIPPEEL
jgi:hypothetical protein